MDSAPFLSATAKLFTISPEWVTMLAIMEIQVKLHGILRDTLPRAAKGQTRLTLLPGATVATAAAALGLKATVSVSVNGQQTTFDHVLQDNDELQFFKLIGGGK